MTELELLRSRIREQMHHYADELAGGSCQSFEQYKHWCGIIEGLALAERELLDIQDKLQSAED